MTDDAQLLQAYVDGSELAFRELVTRYVNLVYGNRWAKVYVCGDGHCEIHTQVDPDFSAWENQHMVPPLANGR